MPPAMLGVPASVPLVARCRCVPFSGYRLDHAPAEHERFDAGFFHPEHAGAGRPEHLVT